MRVDDPKDRAARAARTGRPARPGAVVDESRGPGLARLLLWIPRLLVAVVPLAGAAFLLDLAWQGTVGLDRSLAELATLTERAPGRLDGAWWHLDLDPALVGPSGTNWTSVVDARLCTAFVFEAAGEPRRGTACRRRGLYGRWMLYEHTISGHGFPVLPWVDAAGGSRMELRTTARAHAWLSGHATWDWPWLAQTDEARAMPESAEGSELEAIWITLDRPLDHVLRAWGGPAEPRIEVAYDPAAPERAMPTPILADLSSPPPDLRFVGYAIGLVGTMFALVGWSSLLGRGAPRFLAFGLAVACASSVGWWGGELVPAVSRIWPAAGSLARTAQATFLPDTSLAAPVEPAVGDFVRPWSLASSSYADVLGRFDLARPAGTPVEGTPEVAVELAPEADPTADPTASPDALLEHLAAEVHARLAAMPDEKAAATFERLRQLQILGRPEISILFFDAAREIALDPDREGSAAARTARRFLGQILLNHGGLRRDQLAYGAKRRIWESLADFPDAVVANSAKIVLEQSE